MAIAFGKLSLGKLTLTLGGVSLLSTAVFAQWAVPTAFANSTPISSSGGGQTGNVFSSGARTLQFQISASELTYFTVGTPLKSINFRGTSQGTSFIGANSFSDWTLTLGQARNAIGSMSSTFADNIQNGVVVKTGALSLPANAYPIGATAPAVNPWGSEIKFTTPYVYTGGDLVMQLTLTPSSSTSSNSLDAFTSAAAGYGTKYRALSATSYGAATASNTSAQFPAMQIVPEPATVMTICAGTACLLRRKRKSKSNLI